MKQILLLIILSSLSCSTLVYSQSEPQKSFKSNNYLAELHLKTEEHGMAVGLTALLIASILNPIIIYENKKVFVGITREISLGFGKYNSFRISGEFSYIFRDENRAQFRASMKYDVLSRVSKGEFVSSKSFLAIGGGYFVDKTGKGIFPEVTFGFQMGADSFLFIPYIRLRHSFMITKDKPDITDFSLGASIGFHLF